ncbi:hypothetical protein ILYODFUR_018697 [Ilyodon furcidens]|uniref:Uncharacterized protein n=1 Tax=Ilyodon furcidens TaxID=33524 RepID=A0ABV0T9D3_9TELE
MDNSALVIKLTTYRIWRGHCSGQCYSGGRGGGHPPSALLGGISMEGRTDLHRINDGTLSAISDWGEVLRLGVHNNYQTDMCLSAWQSGFFLFVFFKFSDTCMAFKCCR